MLECFKKQLFRVLDEESGEVQQVWLLTPTNEEARELLDKKIKPEHTYQFEIKENRNYEFHKKYMKLIRFCFENLPERYSCFFQTFDQLRLALEFDVKNVEYFYTMPVLKDTFDRDKFIAMFDSRKTYGIDIIKSALELSYTTTLLPEMKLKPRSIAFEKMNPEDFSELYQRMLDSVASTLSTASKEVQDELNNF